MRLFLIGLSMVAFAACKGEDSPSAGAVRVELSYATFRPGCLTMTATDRADPSRTTTQELKPEESPGRAPRSAELTIAVFRKADWSRDLVVTGTAYEGACNDPNRKVVATRMVEVQVPESGTEVVSMDLRAEDLDDDGFVRTDQGGSDCNDGDGAVKPGATELCNGRDDNCSGGEEDAPGAATYYADTDSDGFGNRLSPLAACGKPAGYVENSRDCNDTNATIRPDQDEPLCNGQDENCSGVADDTFNVGASCATNLGCTGAIACAPGGTTSACQSAQVPTAWYVDDDGDGRAGTLAGPGCAPPVPGAVNTQNDCDDSSPFAFDGGTERCDKIDNDCDSQVDEGVCGTVSWKQIPDAGTPDSPWRAVAAHAAGQAWVAGPGDKLAHVEGDVATAYPNCPGDWIAAWARPSDGRVFLGSETGTLATHAKGATGCELKDTNRRARINGLVGFENGPTTTLFAVTSEGRIFRWTYPGDPVEVTRVAANLRDVHGTSTTNLLAVGAEREGSNNEPRAFRSNPDGGVWISESLPALPTDTFLRGVHMVHGQLAYAVGDQGVLLERSNGTWTAQPRVFPGDAGTPDLLGVSAYGRTVVYAVANNKTVYLFNGTSWSVAHTTPWAPFALDGVGPQELWVAGDQGNVVRWGP